MVQVALQDNNQFPALIAHSGVSGTATIQRVVADAQGNLGFTATSLPLPTGAATESTLSTLSGKFGLTAGFVGQTKIAVTGTAIQLSAQALTNGVILTAKSSNSGNLKIGGSGVNNTEDGTGNGYILEPGASCSVAVTNTNVIYFNGTASDILSWIAC